MCCVCCAACNGDQVFSVPVLGLTFSFPLGVRVLPCPALFSPDHFPLPLLSLSPGAFPCPPSLYSPPFETRCFLSFYAPGSSWSISPFWYPISRLFCMSLVSFPVFRPPFPGPCSFLRPGCNVSRLRTLVVLGLLGGFYLISLLALCYDDCTSLTSFLRIALVLNCRVT